MEQRISLLVPSRQRPKDLIRLYYSAMSMALYPDNLELVAYIDKDDNSYKDIRLPRLKLLKGPKILLSEAWNECYKKANGKWLGLLGDDVIFTTYKWDEMLLNATKNQPDNIGFYFGNDLSDQGTKYGTHGFIHQDWVRAVGYFVPPYFSADYVDTWLNEVAKDIGRLFYVDFVMEHLHVSFGKSPVDATHILGRERSERDRVAEQYVSREMRTRRKNDAEKLRQLL